MDCTKILWGRTCAYISPEACFRFSIYLSVFFPGLSYRQMYRKFKKVVLGLLAHVTASISFSRILSSEALIYNSYYFRTAVLRKLFDIRFSYTHCNFSRVCLLVKIASKTVTRSLSIGITIGNKTQNKVKKYMYILRTSYQLNITISYSYYSINTYLFFPKTLTRSKFRQISNLAFIVPRLRRSFGQVVSDNKLRHPRLLLLAWVSENINAT